MARARQSVRIAVIGTGFGSRVQIPSFQLVPEAEIIAVVSNRQERATAVAQKYSIPFAYNDYVRMLSETQPDLVCVTTPPHLHRPMAIAAIEAGCRVLCDKPMARTAVEAQEMLVTANSSGQAHFIDHELRFHPAFRHVKHWIERGYLGRLHHVHIRHLSSSRASPERQWDWWSEADKGGGALGALGSHYIDLLQWWFGEIASACGRLHTHITQRPEAGSGDYYSVETDDYTTFQLELASGGVADVVISTIAWHGPGTSIGLFGKEGTLLLDESLRLWKGRPDAPQLEEVSVERESTFALEPDTKRSVWETGFLYLAKDLVNALVHGEPLTDIATFEDGVKCQLILDTIRNSDVAA